MIRINNQAGVWENGEGKGHTLLFGFEENKLMLERISRRGKISGVESWWLNCKLVHGNENWGIL
jgi:hypothetical protein